MLSRKNSTFQVSNNGLYALIQGKQNFQDSTVTLKLQIKNKQYARVRKSIFFHGCPTEKKNERYSPTTLGLIKFFPFQK